MSLFESPLEDQGGPVSPMLVNRRMKIAVTVPAWSRKQDELINETFVYINRFLQL
jgi:hypothetical protein